MLQQTTVAAVTTYFETFVARWPTVAALAAAEESAVMAAWAGLGYYSRARNLVACARTVAAGGAFPSTEAGLRALPGIGAYTAAAIAAIAFGRRTVVVDGNIERVVARVFAVDTPLRAAKPDLRGLMDSITPDARVGDFAQAMMDLGATICTPRSPKCLLCPLGRYCSARAGGDPVSYPRRLPKRAKPERRATTWWIEHEGKVLLVRRPGKGLLGGMLALPSDLTTEVALNVLDARPIGYIVHVFTHFRLTLDVVRATLAPGCVLPPGGEWWAREALDAAGLPTVFAKAARVAMQGD